MRAVLLVLLVGCASSSPNTVYSKPSTPVTTSDWRAATVAQGFCYDNGMLVSYTDARNPVRGQPVYPIPSCSADIITIYERQRVLALQQGVHDVHATAPVHPSPWSGVGSSVGMAPGSDL